MSGNVTDVQTELPPGGSAFVVFSNAADTANHRLQHKEERVLLSLSGSWELSFPDSSGAPLRLQIPVLSSLSQNSDPGIKYFSGTVTYHKKIGFKKEWLKTGTKLFLDIGEVKDLARVTLNGQRFPVLWKPPFKVEITEAARAGDNELTVDVTNEWTNRLLGDSHGAGKKVLDGNVAPFGGEYELQQSGLLGPVRIIAEE